MANQPQKLERLVFCRCGREPYVRPGSIFGYYVWCEGCKKMTSVYGSKKKAIETWNFITSNI